MGLLDALRKKKSESTQTDETTPTLKSPLRDYVELLIAQMDHVAGDSVKLPGVPFDINPKKFLPLIAQNVSDEMLESLGDFILIVAKDVERIRAESALKIEIAGEKLLLVEKPENETIENLTELSQSGTQ